MIENITSNVNSPPPTLDVSKAALVSIIRPADETRPYAVLNEEAGEMLKLHIASLKKRTFGERTDLNRLPYVNAEAKVIYLPEALFPHLDELGILFAALGSLLGYEVNYYRSLDQDLNHSEETEKLFIGMKLGGTDNTNINLIRSKSTYELGRAMAFAIRVRGFYRRNKFLTESALRPDNFFFGNNPTERVGNYSVHFRLKSIMHSITGVKPYADALYKSLCHLLEEYNLTNLDESTLAVTVKASLIGIQTVEERHYHKTEVTTGKGRKLRSITELKGPKKPSSSPLFLKEESALISKLITPLYECTGKYHTIDNFYGAIMQHSYRKISSFVRDVFEVRWHILQEYASVTTRRLGEIRGLGSVNSVKKKAACSRDDLVEFLSKRSFPGEKLLREISKILPCRMGKYLCELGLEIPKCWLDSQALMDEIAAFFRGGILSEKIVWQDPIFPERLDLPKKDIVITKGFEPVDADAYKAKFPPIEDRGESAWKVAGPKPRKG